MKTPAPIMIVRDMPMANKRKFFSESLDKPSHCFSLERLYATELPINPMRP